MDHQITKFKLLSNYTLLSTHCKSMIRIYNKEKYLKTGVCQHWHVEYILPLSYEHKKTFLHSQRLWQSIICKACLDRSDTNRTNVSAQNCQQLARWILLQRPRQVRELPILALTSITAQYRLATSDLPLHCINHTLTETSIVNLLNFNDIYHTD